MRLPKLNPISQSRQPVTVFGGLNHNPVIADGEWWDMRNMTADHYPLLAPEMNGKEEYLPFGIDAMISNNGLCYIRRTADATTFVVVVDDGIERNEYELFIDLSPLGGKKLVSMGAYVIILPDKKWVNVAAILDANATEEEKSGDIENAVEFSSVSVKLCRKNGEAITEFKASTEKPDSPTDGEAWIDMSVYPPVLKRWHKDVGMWAEEKTYVRIYGATGFEKGDAVVAPEFRYADNKVTVYIPENPVITEKTDEYIVVPGVMSNGIDDETFLVPGVYSMARLMPDMDFIIESGNRLWGCKYGQTEDGFINEIYASKLGDFKNWNSFQGTSMDSYVASIGADGKYTGAINYNGRPFFFKEDCMIQVYGAYPAQYQVNTINCNGVQAKCEDSLAVVSNRLYYWSRNGVCMYDGSLPVTISAPLGKLSAYDADGGAAGDKYYLRLSTFEDRDGMYVFDTKTGLWHKRDGRSMHRGCEHNGDLYMLSSSVDDSDPPQYSASVYRVRGVGEPVVEDEVNDGPVEWMVESGDIGLTTPDAKYISRLDVRMSLAEGSEVSFFVRYDFEDEWIYLTTIPGTVLRSFDVPIRPKRCDTMRLRIEGKGDAKIYSITKTMEKGGDAH